MLGKQAAEVMKMKVGDLIRLTGGTFKVVGIYNSGDGFEDAASIVSLSDAQQLLQKQRQVGAVQVKVKDPRQIETLRARLEKQFPRLSVTQSGDVADQAQMVQYIQVFAVIIALLALLVGGVGMTNTVMMSMFERTREIGTLRAIGWRRRRVMVMIFGESLLLGVIGGAIGCALGAGMVALLGANSTIGYLQGTVTPNLIALGLITAIGLGAIGGFYPAWRASKMLPIEALQYQGGAGKESIKKVSRVKSETFRSLQRRRGRTYLTITGISIALASIVMLGSITDGMIAAFNEMMVSTDVELVARQKDASDTAYSAISEKIGRQIAATPGVESVSGIVFSAMVVDEMPFFLVFGYAPYEPAINHFKIVEGRGLQGNREIILGRKALEGMKTQIGEVMRLGEIGFRVVGVYETGVSYEESAGVMSLRDAQALTGQAAPGVDVRHQGERPGAGRSDSETTGSRPARRVDLDGERVRRESARHEEHECDDVGHRPAGDRRGRHQHDEHDDHERVRAHARDRHAARGGLAAAARAGDGAEGIGGAESARNARRICERHRLSVADAVSFRCGAIS